MSCDQSDKIHAFHDGELPPERRADVEAHLRLCAACAQLLVELRALSRMVMAAPLPDIAGPNIGRLYGAWHVSRQRGLLRISSWLSAAAAAVLFGALVFLPGKSTAPPAYAGEAAFETYAINPPLVASADDVGDEDEVLKAIEFMAQDLSEPSNK